MISRSSFPARSARTVILLLALFAATARGQDFLPPGHRPEPPGVHALVGARVFVKPGVVIEHAVLVIRDGLIEAVGADVKPPADARVWDAKGWTVYAGFIDAYLSLSPASAPEPPVDHGTSPRAHGIRFFGVAGQEKDPGAPGPGYELAKIAPEQRVARSYAPDAKALEGIREIGFTAGNIVPGKGILRGTSAFVLLSDDDPNRTMLRGDVFQHAAFETAPEDDARYPGSLMGAIAAVRQACFDAQHYALERAAEAVQPKGRKRAPLDPSLEALGPALRREIPVVFESASVLQADEIAHVAHEVGFNFLILASGEEWRRPDVVQATGVPFLVSLKFPELPKLPEDEDWEQVSLDQLRAWDWAPENPAFLRRLGLEIALTMHGLADRKQFRENLRLALDRGLSEEDALAALTTVPARLCGVDKRLGTLEPGKIADLTVVEGAGYFDPEAKIREVWIDGRVYPVNRGKKAPDEKKKETAEEKPREVGGKPVAPGEKPGETPRREALAGDVPKTGEKPAEREAAAEKKKAEAREVRRVRTARSPQEGRGPLAAPPAVLIQGATVWTCGPLGTLEKADVLCVGGRIAAVGPDVALPEDVAGGLLVLDGAGKHITPGLIDCHSHAAVVGDVNEGTIPSSAMVRISDVVNSETDNLYQELAGGLTIANLLHGSANPIGGQCCVIKLRDGATPDGLKFADAPPSNKFALGENVKQANWGEKYVTRYPQSRMGVKTFIANRFEAARQYLAAWAEYQRAHTAEPAAAIVPPRRDLELEALGEMLQGRRLIHCHSYRQDEILMLIRLMDSFGVRIATFQHVLEGYKIADEIAAHGAGGSCFTDWWAYKFEVYDAIPYAGALMHERGVTTSFNSDSAELARRMYLEAAKAVKYGGVSEEDALRFITLFPAKQLRVEEHVGSLETGKDADFALWSGSPLDSSTICLQTWIEGKKYFDREQDPARWEARRREREALLEQARKVAKIGGAEEGEGKPKGTEGFFRAALEHENDYGRDVHCDGASGVGGNR